MGKAEVRDVPKGQLKHQHVPGRTPVQTIVLKGPGTSPNGFLYRK